MRSMEINFATSESCKYLYPPYCADAYITIKVIFILRVNMIVDRIPVLLSGVEFLSHYS